MKQVPCMRCHRVLKDPVSIAKGIGPVCLKKISKAKRKRKNKQLKLGEVLIWEQQNLPGIMEENNETAVSEPAKL